MQQQLGRTAGVGKETIVHEEVAPGQDLNGAEFENCPTQNAEVLRFK